VGATVSLIECHNLSHRFQDGTLAISDIDLSLEDGEFVLLAGRNGSGKTVLVRHFNGLLRPTTGSVTVAGIPVDQDITRARRLVGMVFQEAEAQIVGETVFEEVAFGPRNLGMAGSDLDRCVLGALSWLGLAHRKGAPPHRLSGGERRRLTIAGVLVMNPRVLVLDEPLAGLDYEAVVGVLQAIVRLHELGHTIVLITHDLHKVLAHATRLLVMENGRLVGDNRPHTIQVELEVHGVRSPGRWDEATWLN
jgi:biotin transport system ATP-binding protein